MRTLLTLLAMLAVANATAHADPASLREARQHFDNGAKAYKLGDYERAIAEYRAAYDADPRPLLLFDLGQAYRKVGRFELALHSYQQYLADAPPDSSRRAEASDQVVELEKLLAAQRARQSAPPEGVAEPEIPHASPSTAFQPIPSHRRQATKRRLSIVGWTLGGAGLAIAGGGLGLLLHGNDLASQVPSATSIGLVQQLERERDGFRIAGEVLLTVGGAAVIGSVVILALRAARQSRTMAMHLTPGARGMVFGGTW